MNSPENNARLLRDIDLHIDHALAALRNAHPRSGLDGRILHALERRAAVPHSTRLHLSARLALWFATSAAVLATASLVILGHHVTFAHRQTDAVILSGARSAKSKDPEVARRATNPYPFSTRTVAKNTNSLSSRPEHRSLIAMRSGDTGAETCSSDHPRSGCPIHDHGLIVVMGGVTQAHTLKASTTAAKPLTPSEATLLAELHAPSHPAPPLPLTPQEKALLRLLRYSNATQLASLADLNPTVRSARDAAEAADFQAFFNPPLPTQPDGDTE